MWVFLNVFCGEQGKVIERVKEMLVICGKDVRGDLGIILQFNLQITRMGRTFFSSISFKARLFSMNSELNRQASTTTTVI